jgi:hypothetical protein
VKLVIPGGAFGLIWRFSDAEGVGRGLGTLNEEGDYGNIGCWGMIVYFKRSEILFTF